MIEVRRRLLAGLSLWLVPPSDVADKLQTIMRTKTTTYKSPSSFPQFHPHVTLATVPSTTAVEELRAAVPKNQPTIPVTFKAAEVGDKYFMSVYVTVYQNGVLGVLRDALTKALGEDKVPPMAHVSLFYIDDSEPEERIKLMHKLEKQGRIVERVDGRVGLDCSKVATSEPGDIIEAFDGAEIWVALCDGPVETWTIKDKIRLN